jgi:hypothetical protein
MEHGPGEVMTGFGPVQLDQDPAPVGLVGHVAEHRDRLDDAPELGDGPPESRRLARPLEDADEV